MLAKSNLPTKNKKVLFDTSAIITLLKKEQGYELLEDLIASSVISSVNLSELVTILARNNVVESEIDAIITDIVPEIIPFSEHLAIEAGKLAAHTKNFGLSLGDRACIATGIYYNMTIYTTDKIWLELKSLADIVLIR